ncbi:MAG: lysophospholipid acyltransferase family protein [Methylovulum sp.]|uniref:lysophospholipid acyltransferase family protein n=1 Tax=Methylovulum sp. TaxID=1916980 RepID=UPI00260B50D3|nr:lysophospholipid acyltransferase family protein [Methylovulum sp.]MDD2723839.1 lysophospholipid acyltransferase family protein [Methylovulum sp.]MDD5123717.1 lysophospholipid acyltransferase family protein [Methylovulum sp.]
MTQPNTLYQGSKIKLYLGSTVLLIGMVSSSLIVGPLVLICNIFPFSVRYGAASVWVRFVLFIARVFCGVRHEVEGLENIKDIQTAIVLCKHQSAWETIALRLILPMQTALLKESLLKIPVWGWALATLKPIAINRQNQRAALKTLLKKGKECLNEGLWVVVFPEGTRTAHGEVKKFNAGGAILAEKSGYPVIPIALNSGRCWSRNSFLKYPGIIKVKIGPAIQTQGRKAAEINAEAAEWIALAMQDL